MIVGGLGGALGSGGGAFASGGDCPGPPAGATDFSLRCEPLTLSCLASSGALNEMVCPPTTVHVIEPPVEIEVSLGPYSSMKASSTSNEPEPATALLGPLGMT